MSNKQIILRGNNIDKLKEMADNSVDSFVTDAPYGLGEEPNAEELMKDWIEKGYHEVNGSGFMGKQWDAFVPQPLFWKEVFRVLKHGGYVLCFFGSRTYDWGVMSMRFAGFEIRDCLQWVYGTGMPKGLNISKAIDKMNGAERDIVGIGKSGKNRNVLNAADYPDSFGGDYEITEAKTDDAKKWNGWNTQLKPAYEPIVMARKPIEKGLTIAQNVLKWGTGAINIDACRIGLHEGDDSRLGGNGSWKTDKAAKEIYNGGFGGNDISSSPLGRFPTNFLMSHHDECECQGTKEVRGSNSKPQDVGKGRDGNFSNGIYGEKISKVASSHVDADGMEEVEDWICHPDCPVFIMNSQSGILTTGAMKKSYEYKNSGYSLGKPSGATKLLYESNSGYASRFFYVTKASRSERNEGLDNFEEKEREIRGNNQGVRVCTICSKTDNGINDHSKCLNGYFEYRQCNPIKNIHPTVKPIKLILNLVRMVTPPNGICVDPFVGSGTTGIACKIDDIEFIGIDNEDDYCDIAEARINNFDVKSFLKKDIPKNNLKTRKHFVTSQSTSQGELFNEIIDK